MNIIEKIKLIVKKDDILFVFVFLLCISYFFALYFFQDGKNLIYADAISRLDIARKIVDNITPGLPQIGNVWLPLPQLFMLPFIWNEYLWHSGIAGYLMSGISFIIGGIFIYKSAKIIANSNLASVFALLIYALNINILYLQATAMSESIFLASLAATIYFFLEWVKTKSTTSLIIAALCVSIMTLIRYEGLAILLSSIPFVFGYEFIIEKKRKNAEGKSILYATLACLGFALWTLYLTVIFGNPLYWKDYYATPQATGGAQAVFTQAKPFLAAVWQYFTSLTWMAGVIPTILAVLGLVIMIFIGIKRKSLSYVSMLIPLAIFLFMVLTLQRNTPIVQPDLSLKNILSGTTSLGTGFNIRYGILLLPWIAIMSSFLFIPFGKIGKIILFVLLLGLFSVQIYTYFIPNYTLVYKIPARLDRKPFSKMVAWMQKNYDGGKILVSAGSEEDQMFAMGFNYSTFIHEGTNKYWKESMNNPSRYAKWIVIDYGHSSDNIAKLMHRTDILDRDYKVVYTENQLKIYKKITNPYYEIK